MVIDIGDACVGCVLLVIWLSLRDSRAFNFFHAQTKSKLLVFNQKKMGFTYSLFSLYLVNLTINLWFFICINHNIFTSTRTTYPPSHVSTITFTLNKRLVPHIKITSNIVPRLIEFGFVCLVAITTIAFCQ